MENTKRPENEACPSDDFESGEPKGKCWGDGHYMCNECKHLRPDFKGDGWKKRDAILAGQGGIQISTL
jgi:hypothetical protein